MSIEERVRQTLSDQSRRIQVDDEAWSRIEGRLDQLGIPAKQGPRQRILAGVVALAVFAVAAIFLWNGFRRQPASQSPAVAGGSPSPVFADGTVSFREVPGWGILQGGALSACATTASFAPEDIAQSDSLGPNDLLGCRATAAALPSDGVLINVNSFSRYAWATPSPGLPASELPPTLDPSSCGARVFEGQPPGTTECHVWFTANDREVIVYVFMGTESPGPALMHTAQAGLDLLQVSEPASLGNAIAFEPTNGWYDEAATPASGQPEFDLPAAWTSNEPLAPYSAQYLPAGPSNADIAQLSPAGVIVSVEQDVPSLGATDDQSLTLPEDLSKGRLIQGGWEGMAATDVSQIYLRGVVNGRPVIVQVFFHTRDPSRDLIRQAGIGLARLVVVPSN